MLIKLTNQCTMGCPHCMEDAKENGEMMTLDTFIQAIRFGDYIGRSLFILSGGEPTENGYIADMCNWFDTYTIMCKFSIASNGMWLKDDVKRKHVEQITKLHTFAGMQVYTHKRWYKEYEYVVSHKSEYEKYSGIVVDIDSPIFMRRLGRAIINADACKETEKNQYFMSCLNYTLMAIQEKSPKWFGKRLDLFSLFCTPSVDCYGDVHMSESRLCPSVGNVNTDGFEEIWNRMRKFRTCGHCYEYNKFIKSERDDIKMARIVLGIDQF